MDLQSKRVFTSRDVKFHENVFPFHFIQHQSNAPLPAVTDFILDFQMSNNSFDHLDSPTQVSFGIDFLTSSNSHTISSDSTAQGISSGQPSIASPPHTIVSEDVIRPHHQHTVRRTTRQHQEPKYLQDYFCGVVQSDVLPLKHHALVSAMSQFPEPKTYE